MNSSIGTGANFPASVESGLRSLYCTVQTDTELANSMPAPSVRIREMRRLRAGTNSVTWSYVAPHKQMETWRTRCRRHLASSTKQTRKVSNKARSVADRIGRIPTVADATRKIELSSEVVHEWVVITTVNVICISATPISTRVRSRSLSRWMVSVRYEHLLMHIKGAISCVPAFEYRFAF